MEKLNDLWLEYEATIKGEDFYDCDIRPVLDGNWKEHLILISKKYKFIKRLVENDKIDKEKIIREETLPLVDVNEKYLLMMLAIQDEPIDVLVSILK